MNERFSFKAIGTSWQIDVPKDLFPLIRDHIERFEANYSRFREDSFVGRIAKNAGSYEMPNDFEPMLALYRKLYGITHGKVTPLIGEVLVAAGYDKDYSLTPKDHIPTAPAWDEVMSYQDGVLTTNRPVQLDFGALGKGYIVDIVTELCESHGVHDFSINAGGDIAHRTTTATPFRVGLEDPADPSQIIGVANLVNKSIAGSSGNRRAWATYHHIIDPELTESPRHIAGLWVVAKTTMLADGLTTALFFMEPEILQKEFDFDHVILYSDQSIKMSEQFPGELFIAA